MLENPVITCDKAANEEQKWNYEYYVNQIYEMDLFLKELTETLENYDEDVILVMYGDHLPALDMVAEDLKTGNLAYCNAGHNAPLIIEKNGNVSAIDVIPNLPLGLFAGFPYQGQATKIDKETMLYLFTDGVNEAENNEKEQFTDDRLVSILKANAGIEPKEMVELTFAEVERHADGASQSDDITVMCIKSC